MLDGRLGNARALMCGTIWEYVYDYVNGAVRLGHIDDEGELTRRPTSEPNC